MNMTSKIILYTGILLLLFLTSLKNYLLFHSLAELFSIVIAFGIFVIGWHSRKYYKNNYLLFIGIAYLFVAFFDTLHTLAYKGMNIFKGYDDNNLPPQLWLVARYMESIALLLAPLFFTRPVKSGRIITLLTAVSALAVYAIFFAGIFPVCFITGAGLTPFKVISEYLIDTILVASLYLLYKNREHFEPTVLRLLTISIACTMVTELCFTVYVHLYGISNLVGHFFKIFSFWFMYRAIIETALGKPYDLLFRELHESEEKYRILLQNLSSGVVVHAADSSVIYSNPMASTLLGLTSDQMNGKIAIDPAWHFLQDDGTTMPVDEYPVRRVLASGAQVSGYVVGVCQTETATTVWVQCNAYPVIAASGEIGQVVVTFTDITERKHGEDVLRESEERFAVAFNNAPIMISISKLEDGTYLDVNQRFLDISGFSREEVIGKTSVELSWISEADRNRLKETMLKDCRIIGQELTLRTKTGKSLTCAYWGEMVMLAGQKRLLSIAVDITVQRRVEQQLIQAQKMESIGSLAGGIAHDFNNMLTVIMGHAQLGLIKSDKNHIVCDHFSEIMKTADRSADLTRQLLAFARKQVISPKIMDLNEVIDGMLKMLRRLIGEDIHLVWHPAPDLWLIKADPGQIDQILANLCVNARDAINGTGRITIETRNNAVDSSYCEGNPEALPGDYVHLSVSDDGGGMDNETMARVFEPFFTTKNVGEGTGLGLATVYGIVKQNNGFINVYSERGKGTTFTIHLPRQEEKSQKSLTDAKAAPLPEGQETILLVEDEPDILQITSQLLNQQGYTLLTAGTPGEAMRLAQKHAGEISLLITDVIMPEMNGKELADRIHSLNPRIKCIYISGYTADIISRHGVLDEGMCFIQKPFSLPEMAMMIRDVLDGK